MTPASIKPNRMQAQMAAAWLGECDIIAAQCGWGAGKTFGVVLIWILLDQAKPGIRILQVVDTTDRYHVTLSKECEALLKPRGWTYTSQEGRKWLSPAGSVVIVKSYFRPKTRSVDHNSLEGIDVHVAIIDEAQCMRPEVMLRVLGRIRSGRPPQLMMCGVPTWDNWWIREARKLHGTIDEGSGKALRAAIIMAPSTVNTTLSSAAFAVLKRMSPREYRTKVLNRPEAPEGAIYGEWEPEHWPGGNWAPIGWTYSPQMQTFIAADWGFRHPSVLFIAHDPEIDADVIFDELNPTDMSDEQLARAILAKAWPRKLAGQAPAGRYLLDGGCGDVAGRQTKKDDRARRSAFEQMARAPADGGIGLSLRWTAQKQRVNLLNGIDQTRRRICAMGDEGDDDARVRRLLCTREMWERGLEVEEGDVSFARAMATYTYKRDTLEPDKDGREHPLDALRYFVAIYRWNADGVAPGPMSRPDRPRVKPRWGRQ